MSEPSRTHSAVSSEQNRWTSDLMQCGVQEWFPPHGRDAGVEHYFATAASMIEAACSGQGFHFHFTANIDTVPVSGPKSVVFVMSEENGLLPRYTGSVDAVFKCYGAKFVPTAQWLWNHPSLLMSCLARDAVVLKRILLARWRWKQDRASESFAPATVHHIPLGYYSPPPAELPSWEHRVNDVFFAGSIRQEVVERKSLLKIPNPKQVVRNDMAESLKRLAAKKHWRLKLLLAEGFVPHAVAWGLATEGSTISSDQYMREMANSRICLAPRGTSFETFRHYEAASVGCIVVSDRLPNTWFYRNIPFIFVKDWREIDKVLERLPQDLANLRTLHEQTLRWWTNRLSPAALANYVVRVLLMSATVKLHD
jgi:Exostosin family.